MNIVLTRPRQISRRMMGQWICLAAISLPFLPWKSVISATAETSTETLGPQPAFSLEFYRLRYEAHQLYGCEPDVLDLAQLASVKRSCRCDRLIEKYAEGGLDGLSQDECELVVEVLPRKYRRLEEYPAYLDILRACRQRLATRLGK